MSVKVCRSRLCAISIICFRSCCCMSRQFFHHHTHTLVGSISRAAELYVLFGSLHEGIIRPLQLDWDAGGITCSTYRVVIHRTVFSLSGLCTKMKTTAKLCFFQNLLPVGYGLLPIVDFPRCLQSEESHPEFLHPNPACQSQSCSEEEKLLPGEC